MRNTSALHWALLVALLASPVVASAQRNPAPTQSRTRLVGYDKLSEQTLLDRITHYNDKIKVLSHAAAQAFSDRGC